MDPYLAVAGCGYWGKNLVRNFANLGVLRSVCDANPDVLRQATTNYPGLSAEGDYESVLDDERVRAVAIATPAATHYEMARLALLAGKDVFVEKPFTTKSQEARELLELSRHSERVLMVGHLLLYHPAVELLKKHIDAGEFGEVFYMYSTRVNLGQVRRDENALWRLVPHDIAMFSYLLDADPEVVSAYGSSYLRPGAVDVVFVTLKYGKATGHVHASWLDPHKIRQTTLVGSEKMVVFDDMEPEHKLKIFDKGIVDGTLSTRTGDVVLPGISLQEPLLLECRDFVSCVESRRDPVSNAELGLKVVEALETAERLIGVEG